MIREDQIQLDQVQPAPVSPTAGERFEAGWDKATVETGMWGHEAQVAAGVVAEIRARLPEGAYERLHDEMGLPRLPLEQQYEAILEEARKHAHGGPKWDETPLTLEEFQAEVDRRRLEQYQEADAVLGIDGAGLAGFAGSMARYVTDPVNLATLPFAAQRGASLGKIMLTEGLLNAAAEAGSLPREFQVARELGLPMPDPALRIGAGFVLGAGLGGAIAGAPRAFSAAQRGATRAAAYLSLDRAMLRARAPRGLDPTEAEAGVAAAAARGAGEDDPMRAALETAPARDAAQPGQAQPAARPGGAAAADMPGPAPDPGGGYGAVIDFELEGKSRPLKPNPEVLDMLDRAAVATFGRGARVVITSGREASGQAGASRRHPWGLAADLRVYDAQGNLVTLDDPRALTFAQNARRYGATSIGAGKEYMGNSRFHIDMLPPDQYGPGQGPIWGSWAKTHSAAILGVESGSGGIAAAPLGRPLTMQDFDFAPSGNASPRTNRVGYVFGQLLARGYDPKTAAALTGNLMQESTPSLNTGMVGDGGLSFGIGQWHRTRKEALERFAAQRGKPVTDLDTQIEFLHWELQNTERAALDAIIAAPDVASAARIASERFWRPGIPHIERRIAYATSLHDQFNTGQVPRWTGAAASPAAYGTTTGTTSRGYTRTGQVRVGDDMFLDVDYQVVDIDELLQATGGLQPRDRSRAASDDWVAATAARLDPALLMPSPTADRGAPLIGPDNIIESGNGRVRALLRAYEQGLDRASAYRDQIERAGYRIPNGVERPVLIARRTTELDDAARRQMVIDAQDSGVARMNATERAEVGERALTAEMMQRFDPTRPLTDAANRDFARAFTDFYPASERGAFIAADKSLSIDGVRQIQDAMFSRAWAAPDIVARAVEAQPGDLKSLFDALAAAAPDFATLRAEIEAGLVRADMDISAHVLEAVRLIVQARDLAAAGEGKAAQILEDLLADADLLDGAWSPLTRALVQKFTKDGRVASGKSIAEFLTRYAREARKAGREGDAFGGAGPLDVLKTIDRETFGKLDATGSPRIPLADRNAAPEPVVEAPPRGMFDDGATSPETVAANDALEADIRATVGARTMQQEMYDQVGLINTDSAAFKERFLGSQVVDENGDPLVVYHATTADFDAFDTNIESPDQWFGRGSYFATRQSDLDEHIGMMGFGHDDMRILRAHVAIKHPYRWDVSSPEKMEKLLADLQEAGITRGTGEFNGETLQGAGSAKFTEWARSRGFDGVLVMDFDGSGRFSELVAFAPDQVMALDNWGSFASAPQRPAGGDLAVRAPEPATAARGDEIAEAEARANQTEELLRFDAELRGLDIDEIEVRFDDGSTFSAREVLDEIDEDRAFADIIDLCAGRGA